MNRGIDFDSTPENEKKKQKQKRSDGFNLNRTHRG